jgi:alkylation response protein AidB-like acyl-CoA dehydrogenase
MQPWQNPRIDQIRDDIKTWAEATYPGGERRDRIGEHFSSDMVKRLGERDLLGICMPARFGGQGRSVSDQVAAIEGLSWGCRDSGFVFAVASQLFGIQMTLALLGSDELNARYLPAAIRGDIQLIHCFTEEGGGSDAMGMSTRATKNDAGDWILTGTKTFITNGPHGDAAMVWARTGEGRSPFALTAFMVDLSWDGVSHGREFEKIGLRTVPMGEVVFDEVVVPADHVIGRQGGGLAALTESTGWERAVVLAVVLGPMGRVLEEIVAWTRTREANGKSIGAFQQVSSKVADMVTRYRMSRMAIYDMAARLGDGDSVQPHLEQAAITKLFVSESYQPFMIDAMQTFGVRGILFDWGVQQDLRDALPTTIYVGTSETMRNTIAKLSGVPVE